MINTDQKTTYFTPEDFKLFKKICRFISFCELDQKASILNEILMLTPILAFNRETKSLDSVSSVTLYGEAIQLNLGELPHP